MRTSFWSPEALTLLKENGRQDLIDRGDAFAQRVTALIHTSQNILKQWSELGNLYNNKGGVDENNIVRTVEELEEFVNCRLRAEMSVLEDLILIFGDMKKTKDVIHPVVIEVW